MPEAAAIWSAVAASFAALSSFLTMTIHRRNLLESVRPELVLDGWTRRAQGHGDGTHEVIASQRIRNVGRGAAFNVTLNSSSMMDNRPTAVLSTARQPILAANEAVDVSGEVVVWWKNVKPVASGHRHLPIAIRAYCWDRRGRRHETKYQLLAVELADGVLVADAVACL